MSKEQIILTTQSELLSLISKSVKAELLAIKKDLETSQKSDPLHTRDETCEILDITRSTLYLWTKSGKIQSKKLGNRVYYLKSDILKALNS